MVYFGRYPVRYNGTGGGDEAFLQLNNPAGLSLGVYLWAFFDPRRQGLHDKAAGTLVVRRILHPVTPIY